MLQKLKKFTNLTITIKKQKANKVEAFLTKYALWGLMILMTGLSIFYFIYYLNNNLGLAYNDARSHLDIGRRVVEGLKPGLAQLGSVWLPLNHVLMVPLIWNDWAWHSGFAGAVWNMFSYVATGWFIYKSLEELKVGVFGRVVGVLVFALNLNALYLQATAMTEPLLLLTMTATCFYLLKWAKDYQIINLIKASVWVMLATTVRYDGWFLLGVAAFLVALITWKNKGLKEAEGIVVLFSTMGFFGIVLWVVWNWVIFNDPLYFIFGPFSAHAQQEVLEGAGNLPTKGNVLLSVQIYFYALFYNSIVTTVILGFLGSIALLFDKKLKPELRIASLSLMAPLAFNIIALFLGFSVIFIQGISGNTWFNVRYGMMLLPTLAIMIGYLVNRFFSFRWVVVLTLAFVTFFAFANGDSVSIDDARVGSSQKNVTQVASYLEKNAKDKEGYILISAASHDAIIFSSTLPMKRFIHEGTGKYWESAIENPDLWARWIVMRTYDMADLVYKGVHDKPGFPYYHLVDSYPFADVYELDEKYLSNLNTEAVFKDQK